MTQIDQIDKNQNGDSVSNNIISSLENRILNLEKIMAEHVHNGIDKTSKLKSDIELLDKSFIAIGKSTFSSQTYNEGKDNEVTETIINSGPETTKGWADATKNAQLYLITNKSDPDVTFFSTMNPTVVGSKGNVTSGGSNLIDKTKKWVINEFVGARITIWNNAGTLIQTELIDQNTENTIRITATWTEDIENCSYLIFKPVLLGRAANPWKRLYVAEDTSGGIRFGYGPSDNSDNSVGFLYMKTDGNLYYKDVFGTEFLLNHGIAP